MDAIHKNIVALIKALSDDPTKAALVRHLNRALAACEELMPKK